MKLGKVILLGVLAAGAALLCKKYQDSKALRKSEFDGGDFPEPDLDGDIPAFDGEMPAFDGEMPSFDEGGFPEVDLDSGDFPEADLDDKGWPKIDLDDGDLPKVQL